MKKLFIVVVSFIFIVGCQEVSVYQKFGQQLTQFNNGKIIKNSETEFSYQLESEGILLTVHFVDKYLYMIMNVSADGLNTEVVYEFCNQVYDFSVLDVVGNEDAERLQQLYIDEFNRLLKSDLVLFSNIADEYCQIVNK